MIVSNMTGCSSYIDAGSVIGEATEVEMVKQGELSLGDGTRRTSWRVTPCSEYPVGE